MNPEIELIGHYPLAFAAEVMILMRRLAYLKASIEGLPESQLMAWHDVRTRADVIDQLSHI